MAPASIKRLPVEIVQEILLALPNIQTLKSAIFSSRIFHGPFQGLKEKVIKAIMPRDFTPRLLRLALIIEILPQMGYSEVGDLRACLAEHLDISDGNSTSFSMRRFHSLLNQNNISIYAMVATLCWVDDIVDRFAQGQLKLIPGKTFNYKLDQPLSRNERNRIRHCVYRVAIYAQLSKWFKEATELQREFFDKFSMWENEELYRISKCLQYLGLPGQKGRQPSVLAARAIVSALSGPRRVGRDRRLPASIGWPSLLGSPFDLPLTYPRATEHSLSDPFRWGCSFDYPDEFCTFNDEYWCIRHSEQERPSFRLRNALKQVVVLWDLSRLEQWGVFRPFTERNIRPLTIEDLDDNNGDDAR